jgi:hypothetical protein
LIPLLPTLLEALIRNSTRESVLSIVQLINQLVGKFRGALLATIDTCFLPVVAMIAEAIKAFAHVNTASTPTAAYSSDKAERLDIQRIYYVFLKDIVTCDLTAVLTSSTNAEHTPRVLDTVLQGLVEPPDLTVNKTCFLILQNLIPVWHAGAKNGPDPVLLQFVLKGITICNTSVLLLHRLFACHSHSCQCS